MFAFSPQRGPEGVTVEIRGRGFSAVAADNTVTVGGVPATVLNASANILDIELPTGAITGPIQVTVGWYIYLCTRVGSIKSRSGSACCVASSHVTVLLCH